MIERRQKRSDERIEALQFLVEAVKDRSDVQSVALVDAGGRIVAGTGLEGDLRGLARAAEAYARGDENALHDLADDADLLARTVVVDGSPLLLAALGTRVRKMGDAAKAIARIVERTAA